MNDFYYLGRGINGEPDHTGDVLCWCAPKVETHPGGDVIIHQSLAEVIERAEAIARQLTLGEAAAIAQTWPDAQTTQIEKGWDEYAISTAIASAIRESSPPVEKQAE